MSYKKHRYLLLTLDPVHVGTGGYHLGRVDLSIVRERGTNVPKIPGTSLSGATRNYTAVRYGSLRCAGQGQLRRDAQGNSIPDSDHCGQPDCPICYTFGSLRTKANGEQKAYSGVVNLFDAHILLFPVHSMAGPVWISTPARLRAAGLNPAPEEVKDNVLYATIEDWQGQNLNLGWLLLDVKGEAGVADVPTEWDKEEWRTASERLVLTSEKLFGQIVNSNLEVRTSVSIDPLTGAAEEGALFTYEAIPRATFLSTEVVQDDFRNGFPSDETARLDDAQEPWQVVHAGLKLIEWLGVGGMGTRGFGRLRVMGEPVEETAPWRKQEVPA